MNSKSVLWIILKILSFRTYLLFLLQFLILYNSGSQAQWVQTNGPYSGTINCLALSGTNIFAGNYGAGVWRRPLSEFPTDISKEPNDFPQEFSLSQNYPNPFNPNTTIKYSIANEGNVKLKYIQYNRK